MSKLHRFAMFLVLFYIPAWLKCGIGADAGINNLNFLKDILQYKAYDGDVGEAGFVNTVGI